MTWITPERNGVWRLRATISKVAKRNNKGNSFVESFDTGKTYNSEFVAVGVTAKNSKDNWRSGGYLSQEFKFANGGNYRTNNKAFFKSENLLINDVQIVRLPLLTDTDYKLRYFPPIYFSDVKVQIWEYQGVERSSLADDLTGFLAEVPPSQLINLDAIEQKLDRILASHQANTTVDFTALEQKLDKILSCTCNEPEIPQEKPGKLFLAYYHNLL